MRITLLLPLAGEGDRERHIEMPFVPAKGDLIWLRCACRGRCRLWEPEVKVNEVRWFDERNGETTVSLTYEKDTAEWADHFGFRAPKVQTREDESASIPSAPKDSLDSLIEALDALPDSLRTIFDEVSLTEKHVKALEWLVEFGCSPRFRIEPDGTYTISAFVPRNVAAESLRDPSCWREEDFAGASLLEAMLRCIGVAVGLVNAAGRVIP